MASLTGDSATMVEAITAQCQSYLAAVTSLSLVSEEKQFILLDQAKEASAHAESSLKVGKTECSSRRADRIADCATM